MLLRFISERPEGTTLHLDVMVLIFIERKKKHFKLLIGVFIFNNTISKNIGCPYALGTAMVLCDTDPSDVLYSVNATTTPYNPIFDDAFNYHILRNQKGDYHPFTQNLTRTFFNNLKANSSINSLQFTFSYLCSLIFISGSNSDIASL